MCVCILMLAQSWEGGSHCRHTFSHKAYYFLPGGLESMQSLLFSSVSECWGGHISHSRYSLGEEWADPGRVWRKGRGAMHRASGLRAKKATQLFPKARK